MRNDGCGGATPKLTINVNNKIMDKKHPVNRSKDREVGRNRTIIPAA